MMKEYMRIFRQGVAISYKTTTAYRFEFLMTWIHIILNFLFIIVFWMVLSNATESLGEYQFHELVVLAAIILIGEGLSGFFFGLRDFPSLVREGKLDRFLCLPINTMFAVLVSQIPIVYIVQQLAVGIITFLIVCVYYNIGILISNLVIGLISLVAGILVYQMIYAIVTFGSFWHENISDIRNVIFSVEQSKYYPLSIFPDAVKKVFTFIIPVSLISYYPTKIILGQYTVTLNDVFVLCVFVSLTFLLVRFVWKRGLRRYEANGG